MVNEALRETEQQIRNSYLLDDGDRTKRKRPWILHIIIDDAVKHLLLILTGEWRLVAWQRQCWVTDLSFSFKALNVNRKPDHKLMEENIWS